MAPNSARMAASIAPTPLPSGRTLATAPTPHAHWRSFCIPCPEDVTIDHRSELVYVSSCARPRPSGPRYVAEAAYKIGGWDFGDLLEPPSATLVQGAILTVDLRNLNAPPVNRTADLPDLGAFHPLGIDLFPIDADRARLFVTDCPADGRARVILLDVERTSGALSNPVCIEDGRFVRAPNEIAAVSADSFFLTNSQGGRFHWQKMLENVLPMGFGSIVYGRLTKDGPVFRGQQNFKKFPNGVAYEAATRRLYVAAPFERKVMVYEVHGEPSCAQLMPLQDIPVPVAADNLTWDAAGNLWVAGSPEIFALFAYTVGYRETCPSEIVRIVDPSGAARIESKFTDIGQRISASSVGAYHEKGNRRQLVIGAPFQDRLLVVDL